MKEIAFSKDALRSMQRMPANVAGTLRAKLDEYAADPLSLRNNVKALRGEPGVMRLRVGDWRILFEEEGASSRSSGSRRVGEPMIRRWP